MTMHQDAVTDWLFRLGEDEDAAALLWERFSGRMAQLARQRLRSVRTGAFDEEDVALSAFNTFCQAMRNGRSEPPDSRDGLWRLLAVITARKANQRIKQETRLKRGGDVARTNDVDWHEVTSEEPTPEVVVLLTDQCRQLLEDLPDDDLRRVAILKLEGLSNKEIVERTRFSRPTIQRMLKIIRQSWERME